MLPCSTVSHPNERDSLQIMSEKGAISARGIDRYPETDVRPMRLALAGHPVLQSIRVRNHLLAEGIDEA